MKRFAIPQILLAFAGALSAATHPITIHTNRRVVSFLMPPSEYGSWINNDGFNDDATRESVVKELYGTFNDAFDFIFLVLNEDNLPTNLGYAEAMHPVSNKVAGIGQDIFDRSADYGSAGRLKAVMALPINYGITDGPSLHEIMHNWGNYGIRTWGFNANGPEMGPVTEYRPHWGIMGGNTLGQLGGFVQDSLVANVGGNPKRYRAGRFGQFINGVNTIPYSQFELYLMGMIPLSGVAPFDVFRDITAFDGYPKPSFEFEADTRVRYDNARILSELGARSPAYPNAQRDFRLLIVVLCDTALTDKQWAGFDKQSEAFGRTADEGTYNYNFWEATGGRGTLETGHLDNAVKGAAIFSAAPKRAEPTWNFFRTEDGLWNLLGRRVEPAGMSPSSQSGKRP